MPDTTQRQQDVHLPLYYRENSFPGDSLFHTELPGKQSGMVGDDVPYSFRGDDVMTALLLLNLVLAVVATSFSRDSIVKQVRSFLYTIRSENQETHGSLLLQLLSMQTCLLLAVAYHIYVVHFQQPTFTIDAPYLLVLIYFAVFTAFFLLRITAYSIVNNVFFDSKKNQQWIKGLIFITAMEGVAILPAVILQVYSGLSIQTVVYYFVFILVLAKILTFYKAWLIFFRQISIFLQIILYLCALELIPLLSLWGILASITNVLKVTF